MKEKSNMNRTKRIENPKDPDFYFEREAHKHEDGCREYTFRLIRADNEVDSVVVWKPKGRKSWEVEQSASDQSLSSEAAHAVSRLYQLAASFARRQDANDRAKKKKKK
jgi:hypothetical protein